VNELLVEIGNPSDERDITWELEKALFLGQHEYLSLASEQQKVIALELVRRKRADIHAAYRLAKLYPNEPICIEVIRERSELRAGASVGHSQSSTIRVTESKSSGGADYTISLFKSRQERDFFDAMREVFPNNMVYPNVAVSCLVNTQALEAVLKPEDKGVLYTAIIDLVVFDASTLKPLYFFELDSAFHDLQERKAKDQAKDRIISLAGGKVFRIRKVHRETGRDEFIQLIKEILST
jgi:very-short-patch-repair endonuclease